jgi:hypothetical protein
MPKTEISRTHVGPHASELFANRVVTAQLNSAQYAKSNAALASNTLRRGLERALAETKGKLEYSTEFGRWIVSFGKRDSYWPDAELLATLRRMQDGPVRLSGPVKRAA